MRRTNCRSRLHGRDYWKKENFNAVINAVKSYITTYLRLYESIRMRLVSADNMYYLYQGGLL